MPGDGEAERTEHAAHLLRVGVQAGEPLELRGRELDPLLLGASVPRDRDFRRRAAAQVEHQFGRELEPGHHEGRIDAALKPIARVGMNAELAAGLGDVGRIPQRGFDQHVGGRFRAASRLAALNPATRTTWLASRLPAIAAGGLAPEDIP